MNTNEGLSGESFRTGRTVRCDDAQNDSRIDADARRLLNLGSALFVPICRDTSVIGVFDVFCKEPYAVSNALVATASEAAKLVARIASETATVSPAGPASPDVVVAPQQTSDREPSRSKRGRKAPLTFKFLLLVSVMAYLLASWYWSQRAKDSPSQVSGVNATTSNEAAGTQVQGIQEEQPAASDLKVEPQTMSSAPEEIPAKPSPAAAPSIAATRPTPEVLARGSPTRVAAPKQRQAQPVQPPQKATPISLSDIAAAGRGRTDIAAPISSLPLATPTVALADLRHWPDAKGGKLIHKVEPVYPEAAKAAHLSGNVVLRATIAKDGSVRDVKVVNGNPVLAEAAARAVSQWRYVPYTVRGEPVEVETEITTSFAKSGLSRLARTVTKPVKVLLPKGAQKEGAGTQPADPK